jgi:hypothetical protein
MKKRHAGRLFGAATGIAAVSGIMLLCITAWGLTSCSGDDDMKEGNQIISFEIKDARVFINEVEKAIDVYVPADTNVTKLTPVVKISSGASVVPLEEDEVDFTYPQPYVVTAENGVSRTYKVTVTADVVLNSIAVKTLPTKTIYTTGESFSARGLVVVGAYSDGSVRVETEYALNPSPVPTDKTGDVEVTVAVGVKTEKFKITVRDSPLDYISVISSKANYAYGEALVPADIVVTGTYADGTTKTETLSAGDITGYDPEKSGKQTVLVTLNGKTDTFEVTVAAKREISVTIGLPNTNKEPNIFGLPTKEKEEDPDFTLSTSQNALPNKIVISVAGVDDSSDPQTYWGVYSEIKWSVDGASLSPSTDNIIVIDASKYTLKIPHRITFIGTKDGVEYSRTITFTVER